MQVNPLCIIAISKHFSSSMVGAYVSVSNLYLHSFSLSTAAKVHLSNSAGFSYTSVSPERPGQRADTQQQACRQSCVFFFFFYYVFVVCYSVAGYVCPYASLYICQSWVMFEHAKEKKEGEAKILSF